jgi:hypothetical protein
MNLREMIDMAKEQAAALDAQAPPVPQMDGSERAIKRKNRRLRRSVNRLMSLILCWLLMVSWLRH